MERDLTQDLTKQYSSLFQKKGLGKVLTLARDIYRSGKVREVSSFAVWELAHRLHLFPKQEYLILNNQDALELGKEELSEAALDLQIARFFDRRGMNAIHCEHNWKLLFTHSNGEIFGSLYPDDFDLYRSDDRGQSVHFVHCFPEQIKSIFVTSRNNLLVGVRGAVYQSADNAATFQKVLELGSPISFPRHNNAITETPDGTLYIGEYGNIYDKNGWRKLAFLYASRDGGKSWEKLDFLIGKGANKHVHIVRYSNVLDRLLVADGDNYKKLWISGSLDDFRLDNPEFHPANRFHIQMGGYTAVAESDGNIFFGTDYQGGTNFLVETKDGRNFTRKVIPDPYRRSPIDNMLVRKSEIWANLPYSDSNSKCLLMFSADRGKNWEKVLEYNRSAYTVWLVSSSTVEAADLYFSVENAQTHERAVYKVTDKVQSFR